MGTLLVFDNNSKKYILAPETPITFTNLLLAVKYKHYFCDSKTALKLP